MSEWERDDLSGLNKNPFIRFPFMAGLRCLSDLLLQAA